MGVHFSLLLLLFANVCCAQSLTASSEQPTASEIESWLLSDDPKQIAWGAHYAVVSKHPAFISELLALADQWEQLPTENLTDPRPTELTDDQLAQRGAMAAVLDALIQMNVSVPADTLSKIAADFPSYTAVLLTRLPLAESKQLSFDLYRHPPPGGSVLQYVSAALLAADPPQGFAEDLFSGTHVSVEVFILLPETPPFGYNTAGDCFKLPVLYSRGDWPSFGVYTLSKQKGPGAFPVLSRPDPLYARRSEFTYYRESRCENAALTDADRRRFLAYMLHVEPDAIAWNVVIRQKDLVFHSEPQFEFDLKAFIEELDERYRATAAALVEKGLMEASEEQNARPMLDLRWHDLRGVDYAPIQLPNPLPLHMSWRKSDF
jgi:hypothetical protein